MELLVVLVVVLSVFVYLLPYFIAKQRRSKNLNAILLFNLFFGLDNLGIHYVFHLGDCGKN